LSIIFFRGALENVPFCLLDLASLNKDLETFGAQQADTLVANMVEVWQEPTTQQSLSV
jgi:hypothetical protein